jgi:polyhydroxyalkanoate synthesis regulator phasin
MFETLDRMILAGLGALNMTRERAEQLFEESVRRGQEVRADRERFVSDMMDSAQRARVSLEEMISRQMRASLLNLNLATHEDMQRIEAKLDQLLLARPPV